jgi:sugar lactone lactonase YvrE
MSAVSLTAVGQLKGQTAPYSLASITENVYNATNFSSSPIPTPKSLVFFRGKNFRDIVTRLPDFGIKPSSVTVAPDGTIYFAVTPQNRILKVTPQGVVTTLAGSGAHASADGTGAGASFNGPEGIAIDSSGNIYVADTNNNRIRKITTPGGVVTTLAGSGSPVWADGTGAGASFNQPRGITVGPDGNIYVADTANNLIRKVTTTGVVSTVAASWSAGLNYPEGVAVSVDGTIYVADTMNSAVKKIATNGVVTTFDGFAQPQGITVAPDGNIYVADTNSQTIKKITPGGVVTTVAGTLYTTDFLDGIGTAAAFNYPLDLAFGPDGNIYVADNGNTRIRKIILNALVA